MQVTLLLDSIVQCLHGKLQKLLQKFSYFEVLRYRKCTAAFYYLMQGCQTRFSSGATSGKFNLKRAGPM